MDIHAGHTDLPKYAKLIIVLMGLGCTAMLAYHCKQVADEFLDQPYVTKMDTKAVDMLQFPWIRLCPTNWMNASNLNLYGITPQLLEYMMEGFVDGLLPKNKQYANTDLTTLQDQFQSFVKTNPGSYPLKLFDSLSLQCSAVFAQCTWQGNTFDCCKYTNEVYYNYGRCFMLNATSFFQNLMGPGAAMKITINLDSSLEPTTVYNRPVDQGVLVSAASGLDPIMSDYTFVPEGFRGYIELSATQQVAKRDCIGQYPHNEYLDQMGNDQTACSYECTLRWIFEACKCKPFVHGLTKPDNMPYCEPAQYIGCYATNVTKNMSVISENCLKIQNSKCPKQCEQWQYSTKTSLSLLSTHLSDVSTQNLKGNEMADFYIYYGRISFLLIEDIQTFTAYTLLSNIGGLFGLWLGMSILEMGRYLLGLFAILPGHACRHLTNHVKSVLGCCEKAKSKVKKVSTMSTIVLDDKKGNMNDRT